LLALFLGWGAVLVLEAKPGLAALLLVGALSALVTLMVIEPTTERATKAGAP
jgi:hypothetical protein